MNEGIGQVVDEESGNGHVALFGSSPDADPGDPSWQSPAVVNEPPVVDAGMDRVIVLPMNSIQLDGTVVDDGLPANSLLVSWRQVNGPADAAISDEFDAGAMVTFPVVGTYELELTGSDGEFAVSDRVVFSLETNRPRRRARRQPRRPRFHHERRQQ